MQGIQSIVLIYLLAILKALSKLQQPDYFQLIIFIQAQQRRKPLFNMQPCNYAVLLMLKQLRVI